MKKYKVACVIPIYNEAFNLKDLWKDYKLFSEENLNFELKVIFVNDGSTDESIDLLYSFSESVNLKKIIINHASNLGLKTALISGLSHFLKEDSDYLVIMDGDSSHKIYQLNEMMKKMELGFDLIIASRFLSNSKIVGLSNDRMLYSKILKSLYQIRFFKFKITDFSCGYRLYKKNLIEKIFVNYNPILSMNSFACMTELLLKSMKVTKAIGEVPLDLRYDLKRSKSKMPVVKTIIETFKLLIQIESKK